MKWLISLLLFASLYYCPSHSEEVDPLFFCKANGWVDCDHSMLKCVKDLKKDQKEEAMTCMSGYEACWETIKHSCEEEHLYPQVPSTESVL